MKFLVRESIGFQRKIGSKRALKLGEEGLKDSDTAKKYVENKALELSKEGFHATMQVNEYNGGIYEIDIEELVKPPTEEDWMVSFLTFDNRKWFDKKSEIWGWGIWDQVDGDIQGEYGLNWDEVKANIYKLAALK